MTAAQVHQSGLPERFSGRPRLNLGCGRSANPAWINVDGVDLPGVDLVLDLNDCRPGHIPLPDGCIEGFFLSHVLEYIPNTLPLMQELHRVAKAEAVMTVRLPHGANDEACEDPTYVRAYFPGSFGYFSQPHFWRAEGLSDNAVGQRIAAERHWVLEMIADLRAVKPIRAQFRDLQVPPRVELHRVNLGSIA